LNYRLPQNDCLFTMPERSLLKDPWYDCLALTRVSGVANDHFM
jgi:hypothetical protein